ncbi:ABC transporter permease OS=Streptomyces griseorubiginosus OX=67304 GN=AQJ54_41530 PE=3 SV=1 [Streptomyces griseorubiginosus]
MGERPGDTLVDIAGLNAIPDSLSEAAVIDGANAWQRFWRIKFRLLAPAFTFSVVVTFIGALGAFDIVQATTQGGPGNATTVLNIAMFSQYAGDSSAPLVR